ncbi:hypothetical protein PIB30_017844 [Stylosanthes scabra]|uniref:Uncharacterized protein n=1 Tax=Stylosanthes scabra TaxID=79078 RepID=A0ABU6W7V3_9FABA|nr:hypothetical protein [Stylosanthes scabra]
MANPTCMSPSSYELGDDLVRFGAWWSIPTSLGISDDGRRRVDDRSSWLRARSVGDCAWMFDGATKDRVYALSLASRVIHEMGITWMNEAVGRNDERDGIEIDGFKREWIMEVFDD